MSRIDDYVDYWIETHLVSGHNETLVRRMIADVLEFKEYIEFKTIPIEATKQLRIAVDTKWYRIHDLGTFQKIDYYTKKNKAKLRCRCCRHLIKPGQPVIKHKYKDDKVTFSLTGSIHAKEEDCIREPYYVAVK